MVRKHATNVKTNKVRLDASNNDDILPVIKHAADNYHTVEITYISSKGVTTKRVTEPYEIRGNMYFGYCLMRNSIRQFNIDNITHAKEMQQTFKPRWPVQI